MRRPIRKRLFVASALAGMAFSLASAPAMAAGELVIRDFVLTHGVYEREPVGTTDSFMVDDQKAFAFVRINNEGEPTRVKFVWRYFGEEHANIPMNVGQSSGWRTWSSVNLRPGDWSVQVVSDDGVILAQILRGQHPGCRRRVRLDEERHRIGADDEPEHLVVRQHDFGPGRLRPAANR